MVVLLRAFTHLDAYEDSLERAGLRPYVVGGRGYWSQQQVADVCALLATIANPLDDQALLRRARLARLRSRPGHALAAARRGRPAAARLAGGGAGGWAGRERSRSTPSASGRFPRPELLLLRRFAETLAGLRRRAAAALARRPDRGGGRPRPATTSRC